jgi:hypothetical protein
VALGILPARPDRTAWPSEDFWIFDDAEVQVELVSSHLTLTHRRDVDMYVKTFLALADEAVYGAAARSLITSAIATLDT